MKIFLSLFSIFFFIFKCLDPKANGTGNLGKTWGKPEGNLISKQPWPGGKFRRSFLLTMCGLPVDINQNVGGWVFLLKATAAIATTTIWECSWNFQFRLGAVNLLNCCVLALSIIWTGQDFPTGESAIKLPTYQSIQDEHKRMMDLPTPISPAIRHHRFWFVDWQSWRWMQARPCHFLLAVEVFAFHFSLPPA